MTAPRAPLWDDERWEPVPVPKGDGRHDIGDDVRAAIVQRLTEDWSRDPDLTPEKVRQLAMWAGASVRALLHELGTLRDLTTDHPTSLGDEPTCSRCQSRAVRRIPELLGAGWKWWCDDCRNLWSVEQSVYRTNEAPQLKLGDERIAEIRHEHEVRVEAVGIAEANAELYAALERAEDRFTTLQAEVEAREQAAHRSGVNEAPTLSEADKRFYARKRVSEASGEDARICPQDGSTCWGPCEVSYCRGYADARDAAEQQRTEAEADLARVRQERDEYKTLASGDQPGSDALTVRAQAEQLLQRVRSMDAKAEQSRRYGPAQRRADQLEVIESALQAVQESHQQTHARLQATIERLIADPVRQECDSLKEQRDTWHANYLVENELRLSAEALLLAHQQTLRGLVASWRKQIAEEDNDEWGRERASTLSDAADELEALIDPGGQK
jgi:ribosomal protein L37AE/L43A